MSEGEKKVIEILTDYKNQILDRKPFTHSFVDIQWAINSILDLYQKEKEKNKLKQELLDDLRKSYISRDKIKEKADDYEGKGYIEIAGAMRELLEERN